MTETIWQLVSDFNQQLIEQPSDGLGRGPLIGHLQALSNGTTAALGNGATIPAERRENQLWHGLFTAESMAVAARSDWNSIGLRSARGWKPNPWQSQVLEWTERIPQDIKGFSNFLPELRPKHKMAFF